MLKKSKPPLTPRKIIADDLAVEQGGETYYPHAGESVSFKGRPSVGLYVRLAQLGSGPEGLELLVSVMDSWDWTDDEGKAYANPPSLDDVMRLPAEEIGWLVRNAATEPDTQEAAKNGHTPST